ncbi:hypothetical protein M5X00_23235 [Paenibacillus alvei]|uniref:RRN7-type domain-containing protein n=1 Tax=Paenibacillus alvei TaxID=44250 RepID=A0ABT4H7L4_PAEAL|nr:hypothetical protein [Paenibacillus alvei]EJW14320.1 hypothetical protein PAV_14c00130 [Paenibacillus alvei DSM 29]MCY9541871.1 hypothetical protein [Paenibacillus alvei]MCY9737308.1 hypothetical protein [Paenibacillus alvei]MCY9757156.1 hypothetical protein [Paenibacillus alvei]MCY9764971.1 hypothetical protein [Paenibacillus alvei]
MKTCPYCGSVVEIRSGAYYCGFCDMILPQELLQEEGKRKQFSINQASVSIDLADMSTPELMTRKTYELLILLRHLRQKRSDSFNLMRILKKANAQADEFQAAASSSGKDYEWWTRKMWIVENIIRDRMNYVPARITDDYLLSIEKQIIDGNSKNLIVVGGK